MCFSNCHVSIQSLRSVGKAHAPPYGWDEPSDRPEGDLEEYLRIVLRLRRSGRLVPLRGHEPSLRRGSAGRATRPLRRESSRFCHCEAVRPRQSAPRTPSSIHFVFKWQFENTDHFAFCTLHFALDVRAGNGGRLRAVPTGENAGPMWAYFVTLRVRPLRRGFGRQIAGATGGEEVLWRDYLTRCGI